MNYGVDIFDSKYVLTLNVAKDSNSEFIKNSKVPDFQPNLVDLIKKDLIISKSRILLVELFEIKNIGLIIIVFDLIIALIKFDKNFNHFEYYFKRYTSSRNTEINSIFCEPKIYLPKRNKLILLKNDRVFKIDINNLFL